MASNSPPLRPGQKRSSRQRDPKETAQDSPKEKGAWSSVASIFWILALVVALRTIVFEPFYIPSGSMQPTLKIGDWIVADKWSYGYNRRSLPFDPPLGDWRIGGRTPDYGDVIIFSKYDRTAGQHIHVIKRVVGKPGDRITYENEQLSINAVPVPREEVFAGPLSLYRPEVPRGSAGRIREVPVHHYAVTLPDGRRHLEQILDGRRSAEGSWIVPEGHVFVMGDNRHASGDARFPSFYPDGGVPLHDIIGQARFVVFSLDRSSGFNLRWGRFFHWIR